MARVMTAPGGWRVEAIYVTVVMPWGAEVEVEQYRLTHNGYIEPGADTPEAIAMIMGPAFADLTEEGTTTR